MDLFDGPARIQSENQNQRRRHRSPGSISCPTGPNGHKHKNPEPLGRNDLDPFGPLKLAQIIATGNGVSKLASMFEDATVAAASAPPTERNINRHQRQEKTDVYFKDQMILKALFFQRNFRSNTNNN